LKSNVCNIVLKFIVCVKEQLVINLKMIHSGHHSSQLEHVSAVARMVTGLAIVKVVKLIQVIFAAEAQCCQLCG